MAAQLKITADPADVRRAFGVMTEEARRWEATVLRSGRRVADAMRQTDTAMARSSQQTLAQRQQQTTRAFAEEQRGGYRTAAVLKEAEAQKTRAVETEAARRNRARSGESREEARAAEDSVRVRERAEARITRTLEQQARQRRRILASIASGAGRMAMGIGSDLLGQAQDVRVRRAGTEHAINSAAYQAGATRGDSAAINSRVFAFARANRMDSSDLANAINATQTEFSTLGNSRSSQGERMQNLEGMLATAALARDTGQDVSQTMRVSAMLQNAGITGSANRSALLGLTGMAQRGAIELGSVTREAMMPMQSRMATARETLLRHNPQASEQEISMAQQRAALRSFAEVEVARGLGQSPRRFSNVMAGLGRELQGDHRQALMLHNIENAHGITDAQRTALRGMFDHGHLREQFQSGLGLAGGLMAAGIDSTTANNILAGSGHGNAQGLKVNQRDAIAQMMNGGADVQRMIAGVGQDFTEQDVQRGHETFFNEQSSVMTGERESHDAIIANTAILTQLNQTLTQLEANHPIATSVLGSVLPTLAGNAGSVLPGGSLGTLAAGGGVAGAATMGVGALVAGGAGLAVGEGINRGIDRMTGQDHVLASGGYGLRAAIMDIGRELRQALSETPIQVSPVAVAHAASVAATSANAPTEGRR